MTDLARSVGQTVDVARYFNAADFAWVSDQGISPTRNGSDAESYATLSSYFSRLAEAGDRWSISNFTGILQSGVVHFHGELTRGRRLDGNANFKGGVRCSTGRIVALSIGAAGSSTTVTVPNTVGDTSSVTSIGN